MKKVTVILASTRKKHTYTAVIQFLKHLENQDEVQGEILNLFDYNLGICMGCKVCFEKGESKCALKDDRDVLIEKMMASDGVVFACPNYSFQVSAMMKVFLDRVGYIFHRPCFFGKCLTSIVTQGIYGGGKIISYLDFVGNGLGFNTIKGSCITALEPMTEKEKEKVDNKLAAQSQAFYKRMQENPFPNPSLFKLMGFRMGRTSMRLELDEKSYDYCYYRDKGWFDADYFYPVKMGIVKKSIGNLFDSWQEKITRNRHAKITPA